MYFARRFLDTPPSTFLDHSILGVLKTTCKGQLRHFFFLSSKALQNALKSQSCCSVRGDTVSRSGASAWGGGGGQGGVESAATLAAWFGRSTGWMLKESPIDGPHLSAAQERGGRLGGL